MKLRPCVTPGCPELTTESRCALCEAERVIRSEQDRARREPWRFLYGLKAWHEAREAARRRANYECERCGRMEELADRALDAHHTRKLSDLWLDAGGGTLLFDEARFVAEAIDVRYLRVLCDPCHAIEELRREELHR